MAKLTQREWWAMTLRTSGVQAKEAAQLMGISVHTYRAHVRHSLEMLRELSPNHSFKALARLLIAELTYALAEELVKAIMEEEKIASKKAERGKKRPKND